MFENIDFRFKRVYARKSTLSGEVRQTLSNYGFKKNDFKWISSDVKNAADFSLMKSCVDVLSKNPQFKQVVLISGDGDFLQLTKNLLDVRVVVICQKGNYNKKLTDAVSEAYSIDFMISNYRSAWYLGSS